MANSPDGAQIERSIEQFLLAHPDGALWVGFSGGRDSSVLLHALSRLAAARARQLRALHINHGIHPDAQRWSQRAIAQAESWQVPIEVHRVALAGRPEVGEEARARAARHQVFRERLGPDDWILLAHHRDDQAETLLQRLISGAGLTGLAAMREATRIAGVRIGRPLLTVPGSLIAEYAQRHGLEPICDPANQDPRHERSWLRTQVLPLLAQRHPQITARLARTAGWMAESADWMSAQAELRRSERQGLDPTVLNIEDWGREPEPLRFELLAGWLDSLGQPRPGAVSFAHIESDLIEAREDANPQLRWGGGNLRRYRRSLVWVADRAVLPADWRVSWPIDRPLSLPNGLGDLRARGIAPDAQPALLEVSARAGGERFRPAANRPNRPLQHCLQELGVPPWERERLLLLWRAETLVAVLALDSGAVLLRNEGVEGWVFSVGA
ncbi:MAG: tRNA lysidine(34) synthetase TilS [Xanthomonadales bacterium]|nr:tRNA lysidine(34) synthetase TilS [Xanthomonadales bacterium]